MGILPTEKRQNLSRIISTVVYAYNRAKNDAIGYFPYRLMFGKEALLPVDLAFVFFLRWHVSCNPQRSVYLGEADHLPGGDCCVRRVTDVCVLDHPLTPPPSGIAESHVCYRLGICEDFPPLSPPPPLGAMCCAYRAATPCSGNCTQEQKCATLFKSTMDRPQFMRERVNR